MGLYMPRKHPYLRCTFIDFTLPIAQALRTQFLTTTSATRHMIQHRSGVLLAITASAARAVIPNVGPFGVMGAAIEGLCRQLAAGRFLG